MKSILKDGILYIPMTAISEDGKTIGDGMIPIDKDHPDYEYWLRIAKEESIFKQGAAS